MPLTKPQKYFSVIDPSCGSGVFLVGVYKRLIQWWMIQNNWGKPSVDVAKSIIKDSIYGVDIEQGAIQLSVFSLSLALCDTLQPEAIWNDLKFDNLEETGNITHKDFFEYIQDDSNFNKFDLVLGNPPFKSNTDSRYFKELDKTEEKLRPKINNKYLKLPDKQLALFFLEQSMKLAKKDAYVCLVQPAAFLYSNNVFEFRNYLFTKYLCSQIIDFACLNNSLFKRKGSGADVAVSTVFFQKKTPFTEHANILHVTVRETFVAKEKIYFDLTHYDFHWLAYKDALIQKSIWKCNLMGGSRTREIIRKLDQSPKLGTYLEKKVENNGWVYSEGFIVWKSGKYTADFITNQPTLPAKAFLEDGIDEKQIYSLTEEYFDRTRNKKIYEPPHLLIKEKIGKKGLICVLRDDYLTFRNDTIGIHGSKKELIVLEKNLKENGKLYLFYITSTSGQTAVSRATTILKSDIDNLPYSDDGNELQISKTEDYFIDDVLNYMLDFCKGKKNSPLLNKVNNVQLEEYQNIFCDTINTIYDDFKPFNILETDSYVICSFYYKDKPKNPIFQNTQLTDTKIDAIIKNKIGNSVYVTKIVRIYDDNTIYFIKPKGYRFWLKSIAVRDADETFSDLVKMGY